MLFFRKNERDPEEEARRNAGLAALSQGRITPEAKARLASPVRSTDLSCAEFLLTRHAGFESLGVVMGSAFHTINTSWLVYEQRVRYVGELRDLTEAHHNARNLAVERLRREAAALGAHGVVGVKLTWKKVRWGSNMVECTAIGTAIRLAGTASTDHPFTSNLSGSEFWQLYVAGYVPRDLVFGVSAYMVACDDITRRGAFSSLGGSFRNMEVESFSRGLMTAGQLATTRLARSAVDSGGEGTVGMEIEYEFDDLEYEINNFTYVDLVIAFTAIGTSIITRANGTGWEPAKPRLCHDLGGLTGAVRT